jgi:succinate dehydrogenase subunit C
LSAAEILGRTHGNHAWLAFYVTFVAAVAIHAPIGLRTILGESLGWRGALFDVALFALGIALALWGWRAAFAVFG